MLERHVGDIVRAEPVLVAIGGANEAAATIGIQPDDLAVQRHRVDLLLTAVAVHDGRRVHTALSVSHVRFGAMPAAAIAAYVESGEPFGKAGAYAIQGSIAAWIESIDGSHSGIMGLPLYETARLLRRAGVAVA